ncbi:MAG: hypothetical protein JW940_21575 [Polyangiaceae bacterium]|nr:hypothetical protein [Polyangiaceae bacterium]
MLVPAKGLALPIDAAEGSAPPACAVGLAAEGEPPPPPPVIMLCEPGRTMVLVVFSD